MYTLLSISRRFCFAEHFPKENVQHQQNLREIFFKLSYILFHKIETTPKFYKVKSSQIKCLGFPCKNVFDAEHFPKENVQHQENFAFAKFRI